MFSLQIHSSEIREERLPEVQLCGFHRFRLRSGSSTINGNSPLRYLGHGLTGPRRVNHGIDQTPNCTNMTARLN